MHVIVVDFTIKPEFADRFRERVKQQARDSLENEPNCHVFDVCLDPGKPNSVFLYEVYGSADDFAGHLETNHFKSFDSEVADWIATKEVRQLSRLEAGAA